MNIDLAIVARDLRLPPEKIERSVQLLDEGNTIPFITRFRKDQTGGLNEEQLLAIKQRVASLRSLAERKEFIVKAIQSQDKLTDELSTEIEKSNTSRRLEDLYHPFKPRKQSRAQAARQQGLEPLAQAIFQGANPEADISALATEYVSVEKGLLSVDDVLKGVGDLLAERFGEDSELRSKLRKILWETGSLTSHLVNPSDGAADQGQQNKKASSKKPGAKKNDAQSTADGKSKEGQAVASETKPVETKPADAKPAEVKAAETKPAEVKAVEAKPAETKPVESAVTPPAKEESAAQPPAAQAEGGDGATDSGASKSSFKMSSDGGAESEADKPTPEPLKPVEPEVAPATSITDAKAETPVVAEKAAEPKAAESKPTEPKPTEPKAAEPKAAEPKPAGAPVAKPSAEAPTPPEGAAVTGEATPPAKRKKKKKKKKKKSDTAFKDYYSFKQSLKSLPDHQVLAINRGERANKLRVKIAFDEKRIADTVNEHLIPAEHPFKAFLEKCGHDALNRMILPSLEREIRRELTEKSEKHAVDVFATNLKNLLLTPPLRRRNVMAIDPGFKSGCSVAILDSQGQFIATDHLFVVGNKERRDESCKKVGELVKKHNVDMIAIGNGVGCRETEQMVSDAIAESLADHPVRYVIVNEAGTSIYSTSEVGREELPDHTPAVRSAISIGRRLQNPISELVKISPANIGVGMYQHDVKAKHLTQSLDEVVQFCVNRVGVDVNTASPSLLAFVSGMNALTARRVYEHRKQNGPFKDRQKLMEVSGLGDTTFVQSAGFLRIRDGDNPLDSTSIHPESYPIVEEIIRRVDSTPAELFARPISAAKPAAIPAAKPPAAKLAEAASVEPATAGETPPVVETPAAETVPTEAPAAEAPTTEAVPAEVPAAETAAAPAAEPGSNSKWSANRKEVIGRILALDADAIAAELNVGKMLMIDLVRAIKKPMWDPRDKISKPIARRGIIKADELKPEQQLEAQVVNVVDFGVFVDIGLSESCLVHVSQLSTSYIRDPQLVYSVGNIIKVWVTEVDAERRRVKLTAIRPGSKKPSSRRRGAPAGAKPRRADGRPAHARPKPERKTEYRKPRTPSKPKPVTPITDGMLKGEAPMRSFSDLLQFKSKSPEDQKKDSGA